MSTATVLFHQAIAARLGLNGTDHKCADVLLETGPVTAGELAHITGLTTGAITGVIDRLERAGFVRRARDARDRRRVVVAPSMSPALERQVAQQFQPLARAMWKLAKSYTKAELAVIESFMTRSIDVMREQTAALRKRSRGKGGGERPRKPVPDARDRAGS